MGEAIVVTAIVLAAGASTRMGRPKPLLRLEGRTLLEHTLEAVEHARVDRTVLVLGHEAERVRKEVATDRATVVVNPDYPDGMSTSIRAGLRAADGERDAFLIVLADQPLVSASTLDALIAAHADSKAKILLPTYRGVRGNPVLVDRSLSSEMAGLVGDVGCRALFGSHPGEVAEVPVGDPAILLDIDTPEVYERVRQGLEANLALESLLESSASPRSRAAKARPPARRPEIAALAERMRARGEPFVLATVVRVVRPTSGRPGHKAIVRPDGSITGWVGGTCAERALREESAAALQDGLPRLLRLVPTPGRQPAEEGVIERPMVCHSGGTMELYLEPNLPKHSLLVIGDSPVAESLVSLGRLLGYRVTLVAPNADPAAFPDADEVVGDLDRLGDLARPDTFAVIATMGRYDGTALAHLVDRPLAYLGLVASRRRAASILEDLKAQGASDDGLQRVRNPAGLDLGADTPEEIALSIVAEITQLRKPTRGAPATPAPRETTEAMVDPVCGMTVEPNTPLRFAHAGRTYLFCSEPCLARFHADPEAFLAAR